MGKINYLEIFKKAWATTWSHKKLWWFGLIIGSGGGMGFNIPFSKQEKNIDDQWANQLSSFVSEHLFWIIGIVIFLAAIAILFGIFKILTYSGLIRSLIAIENKKDYGFWASTSESKKYFWRILGMGIVFSFFSLALLLVLALPVIFLFSLDSWALGIITALLAILIFIPAVITFSFISKFGGFYILTSDLSLKASIEQVYKIFIKNIGSSIIMSLLFVPLNIVLGFLMLVAVLALAAPFFILGFIFYQTGLTPAIWMIGILGALLVLGFILLLRSFVGVFYSAAWFSFFREIATVKKEEVEIKEELIIESEIQPEKA